METIGLVATMSQESDALLRYVRPWKRIRIGSLPGYSFSIAGLECILVTSGMGERRAAEATRALVDGFNPQRLISFGIAGAVEADLQVGDVILAHFACKLENGIIGPGQALAEWSDLARQAASQALAGCGRRLFTGTTIITGGSQLTECQVSGLEHPILEMETMGIMQVALELRIPLFSLRAISDGPTAPIPIDLGEVMDEDANLLLGKMLKIILRNPRALLFARQMQHNSSMAADNAAAALVAALGKVGLE